ncbi:MAG TPA: ATP-binding protein [Pyrinomonadaceae bacterium]|nr:ATP-binding protein [Pyrinomonadaceae bacterium]
MARNRFHFGLTMLTGLFLLAALFAVLLYAFTPESPVFRGPILLASFIAILIGSLLSILFVVRWLLRPYHQLVGEAQRASIASQMLKSQDEAEFVLETFQSVVAQLQEQRKELEQLSAEARERATSAEKFSERIVASLPSGLLAFDAGGFSMVVNAPGRALLEVDGTVLGESYDQLLAGHPELASMIGDCLDRGTLYRRTEIETVSSSGRLRRLGATIAPIELPPEGSPRGALCLLTDITEVTELREQVALKRNLESLGEMTAGLAHEFKNSIATLHGYAQLLESMQLNDKAQVATASLLNEVRNLSSMVTAFLNFARPQPLQIEDVSLSELVQDCATESSIEVEIESKGEVVVRADEKMLRQAVLNLLRNAAEATEEQGLNKSIFVKIENKAIEIRDSGPGIPEAHLPKIFIPFFTTKPKGHGIGLALAHRIVTEHGGTLTAANNPTGGAVFTIKLPA